MKEKKKTKTSEIKPTMTFAEILQKYPETAEVFSRYNMHCFGCPMAMQETLGEGIKAHGLDVQKVMDELNKTVKHKK